LGCPGPKPGQVQMLHDYAMNHNVKAVLLAVGANDFDFSGILQDCMEHYVETRLVHPTGGALCSQGAAFQNAISPANKLAIESKIVGALVGVQAAMTDAGYTRDDYTVILQNYWSAIPEDAALRIPDVDLKRLEQGGCPLMDGDATALNTQLLKAINDTVFAAATRFRDNAGASTPPLKLLDVRDALVGHRLCERGVDLIERASPDGSQKGTSPTMVDKVEWVAEARSESVLGTPYTLAEGGHANYWGQLAERNCVRQLFDDIISPDVNRPNNPLRNGGRCMHGSGVNLYGEPTMYLGGLGPYRW
jgi:hypothetical protein